MVGRYAGAGHRQRIAIDVAVVRQNADAGQRRVFVGRQRAVVDGHRGIITAGDGHRQGAGRIAAVTVADGVGEGLADRIAGFQGQDRGVGVVELVVVTAIGGNLQAAIMASQGAAIDDSRGAGGVGETGHGQRIAINVAILTNGSRGQVAADRGTCTGAYRIAIGLRHRRIVLSGDGQGQGGVSRAAFSVGNGVGEDVGERCADRQGLHQWIAVVELVAVTAIGGEGQRAVTARHSAADRTARRRTGVARHHAADRQQRLVIDIAVVGQHVAARRGRRILDQMIAVRLGDRQVVDAGDEHGQRRLDVDATTVVDGVNEDVGPRFAGFQRLDFGVGVVEQICVAAVGVESQGAEVAGVPGADRAVVERRVGAANDGDGQRIAVRVDVLRADDRRADTAAGRLDATDDVTAGLDLVFGNLILVVAGVRGIVGAMDGDGDRRHRAATVTVTDGVSKGFDPRFTGFQGLDDRIGLVDVVGEAAVSVEMQGAEGSRGRAADRTTTDRADRQQVVAVRIAVVGQHIAGYRRSARQAGGVDRRKSVVVGLRRVVLADDVDAQGRPGGTSLAVANLVAERFVPGFVADEPLDDRVAGIEGVAVAAVGVEGQLAEIPVQRHPRRTGDTAGVVQGDHLQAVAGVGIAVGVIGHDRRHATAGGLLAAQHIAAGHRLVFGKAVGIGLGDWRIVDAGEGDRHRGGVGTTVAITEGIAEGVGGSLPGGQRFGGGGVGGEGVAAVDIERQTAIAASHRGPDVAGKPSDRADGQRIGGIWIAVVGQGVAGDARRVGRYAADVVHRIRNVVGAVDGDDDVRRCQAALAVADGVGVAVHQRFADGQRVDRRVGVVERIAVVAIGGDEQLAIHTGDRSARAADGDGVGRGPVGTGNDAGDGQRIAVQVAVVDQYRGADARRSLVDVVGVVHRDGRIVAADDGDRQRGAGCAALTVGNGIGVSFDQRLTGTERGDRRVGGIDGEAVAAVGMDGQAAGGPDQRCIDRPASQCGDRQRPAVDIAVVCQQRAADRGARRLGQRIDIGLRHRQVIYRCDIDRRRYGCRRLLAVRRGVGVGVAHRPLDGPRGVARVLGR